LGDGSELQPREGDGPWLGASHQRQDAGTRAAIIFREVYDEDPGRRAFRLGHVPLTMAILSGAGSVPKGVIGRLAGT
jgi:hypothetical protein